MRVSLRHLVIFKRFKINLKAENISKVLDNINFGNFLNLNYKKG